MIDLLNEVERYLARAAGRNTVRPGEDITVRVDLAVSHDVTGPMAVEQFLNIGVDRLFQPERVIFVLDHIFPAATPDARALHRSLKHFCKQYRAVLYEQGEGVCHQLLAERHRLERGSLLIGADSHTCTAGAYGAIAIAVGATELAVAMATGTVDIEVPECCEIRLDGEPGPGVYAKDIILHLIGRFGTDGFIDQAVIFTGHAAGRMTLEDRMTISNMGIEMGAMITYFSEHETAGPVSASYGVNLQEVVPSVACPSSPGNIAPVSRVAGTEITQVVIGSCTNGRLTDMQVAAGVLAGRCVHPEVTLIVIPASRRVAQEMDEGGISGIIRDAGGVIASPGCGPCFGAHMGLLCDGDVAVSTTNRNFPGRMGGRQAAVYLASPRTAAESALAGQIVPPGTMKPLRGECGSE